MNREIHIWDKPIYLFRYVCILFSWYKHHIHIYSSIQAEQHWLKFWIILNKDLTVLNIKCRDASIFMVCHIGMHSLQFIHPAAFSQCNLFDKLFSKEAVAVVKSSNNDPVNNLHNGLCIWNCLYAPNLKETVHTKMLF